ncbi:MAG: alpha/beta fold hydrolase [Acidimicrobiales bacterium]
MKFLAGAALVGPPALWTMQHLRSPAVTNWDPPSLPGRHTGSLYARSGGDGDQAVVLLHGLVSSGDVFGGAYDQLAADFKVVVPDLLGFGRSLDVTRTSFSADDHLEALDELATEHGLFEKRWILGAHSMGSGLALRWAARHHERVDKIVCWGAPIYPSPEAALARISGSTMTRLFVLDTEWAKRACHMSCRNRTASGWLSAAIEPSLPVSVARAVSLHTWPAYRDSMYGLVIDTDWRQLLDSLDNNKVNLELVWGSNDKVGDRPYARQLIDKSRHAVMTIIHGAGHHLPLTQPSLCLNQLTNGQQPH